MVEIYAISRHGRNTFARNAPPELPLVAARSAYLCPSATATSKPHLVGVVLRFADRSGRRDAVRDAGWRRPASDCTNQRQRTDTAPFRTQTVSDYRRIILNVLRSADADG